MTGPPKPENELPLLWQWRWLALWWALAFAVTVASFVSMARAQMAISNGEPCSGVAPIGQTATADLHTFVGLGHICAVSIVSSAAVTFTLAEGTGTNCGTGTTTLVPALNVSNTAPSTDHIEYAFVQLPVSQALCQNSTATVSGLVYINQF